MAFRWLTRCRSCGKDFIDVNFVQEINEEEKTTFYEQRICSVGYTYKKSSYFLGVLLHLQLLLSSSSSGHFTV